ncbi:MAG: 5-(carboxyamino)imidazole ribonucleotide mutase [Saccharofermentanales bacterium]|jgi:5-(carboxyamino)imidazole ribonucleotide mutase|nr:5-(carboxyamino)imidazole ribonucleotide mutase [Bacillota bacterium]
MLKVLVVMGSDSDLPKLKPCLETLNDFGVEYSARVCSAHRTPALAQELAVTAEEAGYGVIIAAAGLAAHLAGVLAAYTSLPVIGLPIAGGALNGLDALYAMVQMPPGIPVATVAIDGAKNAALLAIQILALSSPKLAGKLKQDKRKMAEAVTSKDQKLQDSLNA